jgi:hypothetical protein
MNRNLISSSCLVAFLAIAPGWAQQPTNCVDSGPLVADANGAHPVGPRERPYAYALTSALWTINPIPVCWEEMDPQFAQARAAVREAVANTWERHSRARFSGWQQCAPNNGGVHIHVEDLDDRVGPRAMALGRVLNGLRNGVVLNFTFEKWGRVFCGGRYRDSCIRATAVHEFGHVLGFSHEQNRPDTPGECYKRAVGINGDVELTPWDPFSVMNYCNRHFNNDGQLSELDIKAVQCKYGAPR